MSDTRIADVVGILAATLISSSDGFSGGVPFFSYDSNPVALLSLPTFRPYL